MNPAAVFEVIGWNAVSLLVTEAASFARGLGVGPTDAPAGATFVPRR
jgi:hypothetical protein